MPHFMPDEQAIQANKEVEPEGERLRQELTEWLDRNGVVSILLDTPHHSVEIYYRPWLPGKMKQVLTLWGSIYVIDK